MLSNTSVFFFLTMIADFSTIAHKGKFTFEWSISVLFYTMLKRLTYLLNI